MTFLVCKDEGSIDGKGRSSRSTNLPAGWFKGVTLLHGGLSSKRTHGTDTWWEVYVGASDSESAEESHKWDFRTLASRLELGSYYHDVRRSFINAEGVYFVTGIGEADFVGDILVENGDYEAAFVEAKAKEEGHSKQANRIKNRICELIGEQSSNFFHYHISNDGKIESVIGIYESAEEFIKDARKKQNVLDVEIADLGRALENLNKTMPKSIQFAALNEGGTAAIGISVQGGEPSPLYNVFDLDGGGVFGGNLTNHKKFTDAAKIKIVNDIIMGYGEFPKEGEAIKNFVTSQLKFLERRKVLLYRSSDGNRETQHQKNIRKKIDEQLSSILQWLASQK